MLRILPLSVWKKATHVLPKLSAASTSHAWQDEVKWIEPNEPIPCGPHIRRLPFRVLNLTPMVLARETDPAESVFNKG